MVFVARLLRGWLGDAFTVFRCITFGTIITSSDVAIEIQQRADLAYEDVPSSVVGFVERHVG
jgi:hypothetical protein